MTRTLIIGAGQQGGSILKARLERNPEDSFTLYDISEEAADAVEGYADEKPHADIMGTSREGALFQEIGDADVIALCVPVDQIPIMLDKVLAHAKPGAIIFDIGSEKTHTTQAMRQIHLASGRHDVGVYPAHPGVGAAGASFNTSRSDMFAGEPFWVMKPEDGADEALYSKFKDYLDGLGARVVEASPAANDMFFSNGSWDTYIKAFAAQEAVMDMAGDDAKIVGPSILTALRVCDANPEMWTGIMQAGGKTFRDKAPELTERFEDEFIGALESRDREQVLELVTRAHDFRKNYSDVYRESVLGDVANISIQNDVPVSSDLEAGNLSSAFNDKAAPDLAMQIAFPAVLAVTHLLKMEDIGQAPTFEGIDIVKEGNPSFKDFTGLALNDPEWLTDLLLSEPVHSHTLNVFQAYRPLYERNVAMTKNLDHFSDYVGEMQVMRQKLPAPVKGDDAREEFLLDNS